MQDIIETSKTFNPAAIADGLLQDHVADNVEFLNHLAPEEAAAILPLLPAERAVEILDQPNFDAAPEVVRLLSNELAAKLLKAMSADRAADIFRRLADNDCLQ